MNKGRLEWVLSGLCQHTLTAAEDHFLKTVSAEFERNQALTENQEERLENLYKAKSQLTPNKSQSALKEKPQKAKPRRPSRKYY